MCVASLSAFVTRGGRREAAGSLVTCISQNAFGFSFVYSFMPFASQNAQGRLSHCQHSIPRPAEAIEGQVSQYSGAKFGSTGGLGSEPSCHLPANVKF